MVNKRRCCTLVAVINTYNTRYSIQRLHIAKGSVEPKPPKKIRIIFQFWGTFSFGLIKFEVLQFVVQRSPLKLCGLCIAGLLIITMGETKPLPTQKQTHKNRE